MKSLAAGTAPLPHVRERAKQMYIMLDHTGRIDGGICENCPDPRTLLANVIVDEESSTQCGSDSHI